MRFSACNIKEMGSEAVLVLLFELPDTNLKPIGDPPGSRVALLAFKLHLSKQKVDGSALIILKAINPLFANFAALQALESHSKSGASIWQIDRVWRSCLLRIRKAWIEKTYVDICVYIVMSKSRC